MYVSGWNEICENAREAIEYYERRVHDGISFLCEIICTIPGTHMALLKVLFARSQQAVARIYFRIVWCFAYIWLNMCSKNLLSYQRILEGIRATNETGRVKIEIYVGMTMIMGMVRQRMTFCIFALVK